MYVNTHKHKTFATTTNFPMYAQCFHENMHAQIQSINIMQAGRTPLQRLRMMWEKEQENRIERT